MELFQIENQDSGESEAIKGCAYIYAPAGQAGEYAPLAANPYRGCGHKCAYCLRGDTLIQMADGAAKPIASVQVGESILGITFEGGRRAWGTRITTTTILAKLETGKKPAYKVTLEDGTQVFCSADHRWLTERGWKYTFTDKWDPPRKTLTTNNYVRKVAGAIITPPETPEYHLGYIAGMIEGDGSIGIYDYSHKRRPSGKTMGVQHRFRLALKDELGLMRTKRYLELEGVTTNLDDFYAGNERHAPINAIQTTSPARVAKIKSLLHPVDNPEWLRGWLAGIFDAEGSHGREAFRISNSDERILQMTEKAFAAFDFVTVRDRPNSNGALCIRIIGGRSEELRFWQLCNPAISRKFSLDGCALHGSVKVASIEETGEEVDMFDITTGTENFIANGMVSHNCYVPSVLRITREEFDAGAVPRPDYIKHLTKDARKYQAAGSTGQVMLSFTTDPYFPGDNRLTREVLTVLQEHGLGICTLTKGGSRALRDLDLFRPKRDAFASTLTSLDDSFSRKWERGAALPEDRIATLWKFHKAGIFTWVSLEPTLDIESSLAIVRATHTFVDLYKVGRANYLPMTKTTDWRVYTERMLELLNQLGARSYIKRDLQPYLPKGYVNPLRVPQHH